MASPDPHLDLNDVEMVGVSWRAELRRCKGLRGLFIGSWNLTIGRDHAGPGPKLKALLDDIGQLGRALEAGPDREWSGPGHAGGPVRKDARQAREGPVVDRPFGEGDVHGAARSVS